MIKRDGLPRNPILDNPAALDAYLDAGFAAGKPLIVLMSELLPSIRDEQAAKAERIRQDNEAATARRMARIAAQNDPEKRERERQRFQAKLWIWKARREAKNKKAADEAERKLRALDKNPTLRWRHARRPGWQPDDDYVRGGRRKNKKKIPEPAK